jgi:hypothetical protein
MTKGHVSRRYFAATVQQRDAPSRPELCGCGRRVHATHPAANGLIKAIEREDIFARIIPA